MLMGFYFRWPSLIKHFEYNWGITGYSCFQKHIWFLIKAYVIIFFYSLDTQMNTLNPCSVLVLTIFRQFLILNIHERYAWNTHCIFPEIFLSGWYCLLALSRVSIKKNIFARMNSLINPWTSPPGQGGEGASAPPPQVCWQCALFFEEPVKCAFFENI